MSEPVRRSWFSWLLYWLTLAFAAVLILLVFLSPLLDNNLPRPQGWSRWVALFSRDRAVRHTAVASALCLLVTACVFFRPAGRGRLAGRKTGRSPKSPPPANIAGA